MCQIPVLVSIYLEYRCICFSDKCTWGGTTNTLISVITYSTPFVIILCKDTVFSRGCWMPNVLWDDNTSSHNINKHRKHKSTCDWQFRDGLLSLYWATKWWWGQELCRPEDFGAHLFRQHEPETLWCKYFLTQHGVINQPHTTLFILACWLFIF